MLASLTDVCLVKIEKFTIEQAEIAKNFLTLLLETYKNEMNKVRLAGCNDYV